MLHATLALVQTIILSRQLFEFEMRPGSPQPAISKPGARRHQRLLWAALNSVNGRDWIRCAVSRG